MGNIPVLLAVVTTVTWGLWAIFVRLATDSLLPETALVISYAVGTVIAMI